MKVGNYCNHYSTGAFLFHMSEEPFKIRIADWSDDQASIRTVRTEVFIREQQVPESLEWDDEDAHCIHLLAWSNNDQLLGTARMLANGQIGRLAVLKPYRGMGVGKKMLQTLLDIAEQKKFKFVFLNSQTHAIDFYRAFGFREVGSSFNEAGIPHCRMKKEITYSD